MQHAALRALRSPATFPTHRPGGWRRRSAVRPVCSQAAGGGSGAEGKTISPELKKATARAAVDAFVKPGSIVGIGTGELVTAAVEYMAQQSAKGALTGVIGVPSCAVAASEAAFHGLKLSTLEEHPRVDVFFEQADQLDPIDNAFIKGNRAFASQPNLPGFASLLAAASDDFSKRVVVLAEGNDVVPRLGGSVPVAIVAEGWEEPAEELDDIFLGDAELWRRPSEGTANPRGGPNPYVSDDGGHTIVDIRFYEGLKLFGEEEAYDRIASEVSGIPGVLAHGLVVGKAVAAVIADADEGVVTTPLPMRK